MGKMKEEPRYNVVSFRVSDAELKQLDRQAKELMIRRGDLLHRGLKLVLAS